MYRLEMHEAQFLMNLHLDWLLFFSILVIRLSINTRFFSSLIEGMKQIYSLNKVTSHTHDRNCKNDNVAFFKLIIFKFEILTKLLENIFRKGPGKLH